MDSGNSGSIQSSSGGGGDEEYDSRAADSFSAFFNPPPPPPPHHHHQISPNPPSLFDPNSLLNFDPIWSKPMRSDQPNCTQTDQIRPLFGPSSSSSPSPTVTFPPVVSETNNTVTTTPRAADHALGARSSNAKKRSRASRRAPTTVLTTDAANFRAMVQEFTGIPPPPFASSSTLSSSPFARSGLDLFGAPSSIRSNPYLLRPFAQKLQPPPPPPQFLSNSNSINYQMQNPIHISSPRKYPLPNPLNEPVEIQKSDSHLKMGVFDQLGLGHGQFDGPNLFSLDGNNGGPASWAGGGVGPGDADRGHLIRSGNGNYEYSRSGSNGNLVNFSASSSNFEGDKGSGNVASRAEGMVEPWICSSD